METNTNQESSTSAASHHDGLGSSDQGSKFDPLFVPKGVKINRDVSVKLVVQGTHALGWGLVEGETWALQQGEATSHTVRIIL